MKNIIAIIIAGAALTGCAQIQEGINDPVAVEKAAYTATKLTLGQVKPKERQQAMAKGIHAGAATFLPVVEEDGFSK